MIRKLYRAALVKTTRPRVAHHPSPCGRLHHTPSQAARSRSLLYITWLCS